VFPQIVDLQLSNTVCQKTVQASTKVTIELEYEVICSLWKGIMSNDFVWWLIWVLKSQYFVKVSISKCCILYCPTAENSFSM